MNEILSGFAIAFDQPIGYSGTIGLIIGVFIGMVIQHIRTNGS